MNKPGIHRKEPVYLGIFLIAVGILLRWLIEVTLVSDMRIESRLYGMLILVVQILMVATGLFLLIRQPAIRLPKRSDVALGLFSTFLTFFLLEVGARVWLNYLATPEQYDRYVLFTSLDANQYAWTPHPYLAYSPTPNYHKGLTSHNSLGYRNDEFSLEKSEGVYRIVALGGSSTYDVSIQDNNET